MNGTDAPSRPPPDEFDFVLRRARHDMRSPLHAITMLSSALGDELEGGLDDRQKLFLDQLGRAGRRLRLQSEAFFRWLDLVDVTLAAETVDPLRLVAGVAHARGLELPISGTGAWRGDPALLSELVGQVLDNATRFVPSEEAPRVVIEVQGETLLVHDAGLGVPEERREEVFEPFRRLHTSEEFPGAGMGLTVARRIATLHGGSIRFVEPALGGASVEVRIPG